MVSEDITIFFCEMAWQIGNVVHWFTRVRLINTIFPKPRTTISGLIQTKRQ